MPARSVLSFDPIAEARQLWEAHGWQDSAEAMAVVTSVMRVQQVLLARADAVLKPFGLTFARYEVLMLLAFSRQGTLPLGKIGERLQVNAASVTNAITRLERQGFVVRQPNPADGRGRLAGITRRGRELSSAATKAMNSEVFGGNLGLAEEELRSLFDSLRTLRAAAGDFA